MNTTALDILKKHFDEAMRNHPQENWVDDLVTCEIEFNLILAAMKEMVNLAWEAGTNWADHEPSNFDSPNPHPDLHELLKELFPEK